MTAFRSIAHRFDLKAMLEPFDFVGRTAYGQRSGQGGLSSVHFMGSFAGMLRIDF